MASRERFLPRRLRWRLRGAWQWPVFAVLTLADGIVLNRLPPFREGIDLIAGVIVASFANLLLVGAIAPWIARRVVARDPQGPPLEVVLDRTATALLVMGLAGALVAGLASRPTIVAETEAAERNARAVRDYALANGTEEIRRNLDTANTWRIEEGLFRTCVALDERPRSWCLIVDTSFEPPRVKVDPSRAPNSELIGRSAGSDGR